MIKPHLWHTPFFIFIVFLFLTGCNTLRPAPNALLDNKALRFANQAKSYNHHIVGSKGVGWIKIVDKSRIDKFKIAWAAVFPNKIRITFLLSGHPIETIIASGEKVTFLSHTGAHPLHTTHSKDPDLTSYIKVPVKLSEMILVLLGRFPIKPFDDVYFSPKDSSLSTLTLWQNWKGIVQHLSINEQGSLNGIKNTGPKEQLFYNMKIINFKTIDTQRIPARITLTDSQNRTLILKITSFNTNPAIKESVFRLTAKGS